MNQVRTIGMAILKHHGFFSLDQIAMETKISRKYVTDVLVVFAQEGLVKKIIKQKKEHIPGHSPRFSLTYRVVDRKGFAVRIAPRRFENTVEDRMWFIIRNRFRNGSSFNLHDIMVLAGAKKGTARSYIKTLRRAGFIVPSRSGGGPGVEWKLTGDYGPKKPYIDRSRSKKPGNKPSGKLNKKISNRASLMPERGPKR